MSEEAEDTAKTAKRAATIALFAVAVAVAVLIIDQGIKRSVLEAVADARRIVDEFKRVAKEAGHGGAAEEAGDAGGGAVGAGGGGGDLVHDASAGAVLAASDGAPQRAPAGRKAGVARGTAGDGGRAGGPGSGKVSRRVPPEPGP